MIITNKTGFEGKEFAIQVIARGYFVDDGCGSDKTYIVETYALRLNHVALNAWLRSRMLNCRECYDTDHEWEDHKAEYAVRLEAVRKQLIDDLGIDANKGGITITQSQAEMFAVVHIWETSGLKISTATGSEFEVKGTVTYRDFDDDGRIYFCDGQSFPKEIVLAVI